MEHLAIGFDPDQNFTWSIGTTETDPQKVSDILRDSGGVYPAQILIVKNDNVIFHWNWGKDYCNEV